MHFPQQAVHGTAAGVCGGAALLPHTVLFALQAVPAQHAGVWGSTAGYELMQQQQQQQQSSKTKSCRDFAVSCCPVGVHSRCPELKMPRTGEGTPSHGLPFFHELQLLVPYSEHTG